MQIQHEVCRARRIRRLNRDERKKIKCHVCGRCCGFILWGSYQRKRMKATGKTTLTKVYRFCCKLYQKQKRYLTFSILATDLIPFTMYTSQFLLQIGSYEDSKAARSQKARVNDRIKQYKGHVLDMEWSHIRRILKAIQKAKEKLQIELDISFKNMTKFTEYCKEFNKKAGVKNRLDTWFYHKTNQFLFGTGYQHRIR